MSFPARMVSRKHYWCTWKPSKSESHPLRIGYAVADYERDARSELAPGHFNPAGIEGPRISQYYSLKYWNAVGPLAIGDRGDNFSVSAAIRVFQANNQGPAQRKVLNHVRVAGELPWPKDCGPAIEGKSPPGKSIHDLKGCSATINI